MWETLLIVYQKKVNLPSKQLEESTKERKVIPLQQSSKTSCAQVIHHHAELEITPVLLRTP